MKRPALSAERARALLHYNSKTGSIIWKTTRGRGRAGSEAGYRRGDGYLYVGVDGESLAAHRLASLIKTGSWPKVDIDHRNGDKVDNRWRNLRESPGSVNQQNIRRAKSHSKTGVLGVTRRGRRFIARIVVDRVYRHLGCYGTARAAHRAYLKAKRQLHAGCTI